MRSRCAVAALALATAGLAGSGAGARPAAAAAPGVAAPGQPGAIVLTGTRTVTVTGTVYGGPAPGTYAVTETDLSSGRSRSLAFGPPAAAPQSGIQPLAQAVQSTITLSQDEGPVVLGSTDAAFGIDRGANQGYEVSDVRTVTARYEAGALDAVEHVLERGTGTNGESFAAVDLTRTTNADGSFDETGSISSGEVHELHVRADFSAESHDQTPGFGLRDVTSGPPSGPGPGATIAVTLATQGRTIGNTPVVTKSYTVPAWFGTQRLPTAVDHRVNLNARLAPECGAPPAPIVLEVYDRRRQIDPTGRITEIVHRLFTTLGYAPLCRIDTTAVTYVDVTTGKQTGALADRTVVTTYR